MSFADLSKQFEENFPKMKEEIDAKYISDHAFHI